VGCLGGPVVCVARDWVEVGVWVHCEPEACLLIAVRSQVREDLVDGAGWVLWRCRRQVPELAWVDRAV
jgi:hypothetical protein